MLRRQTPNELLASFAPPHTAGSFQSAGLDSRFEIHDDNQVELKLDYAIQDESWTRYQTEAFIFVPRSLGISKQSYDRRQFFTDIQAYIRFKTPTMSLAALIQPDTQQSPIAKIRKLIELGSGPDLAKQQDAFGRELRMFGCLMRANLRDTVAAAVRRLEAADLDSDERDTLINDVSKSIGSVVDEIEAACRAFREFREPFVDIRCPAALRSHFEMTDEYVSIIVESYLTEILVALERLNFRGKRKLRELTDEMWSRIALAISDEQAYRTSVGYTANLMRVDGRENYVNRTSHLKKFVTSILFLKIAPRTEGVSFVQATAGVAAAVAMMFSMGTAILSERMWGLNSLPFVVAVIVGYVFKDRIKDWIKAFFSARIARWMPDRSLAVMDPRTNATVGHCRETFSYLDSSRIPDSVLRWRHVRHDDQNLANLASLDLDYDSEVCLHYIKDVAVRGKKISRSHDRRSGINDIIRWNVSNFLSRMDDPERTVAYFDSANGTLQSVVCPKRYQLNVVLVLKQSGQLVSVQRYQVELDRSGIQSLNSVELQ